MKIYITRELPDIAITKLKEAGFDVHVNMEDKNLSKAELKTILQDGSYDGVISMLTDVIDRDLINSSPTVKIFSNYAVGLNNIDIEAAKEKGVTVTNTPGVLSESVAEHTITLLLSVAKRIVEGDKYLREGKYKGWAPLLLLGTDVANKTLGLIGAGRIGSIVAKIAKNGLGMNVVYFDIQKNEEIEKVGAIFKTTPEEVLQEADFVSIHVPLLDSTRHLIDKERIGLMKKNAYLINTSRGPVIDETALVSALREGGIRGAALDVFENEPALAPGLTELSNVILTPHTASATLETRSKMAEMAAEAVIDYFAGREPKNKVS